MAIYHLNVTTGSKSNGQSAKAKAEYVLRQGRYNRGKTEVLFSQSENMPLWSSKQQPVSYWQAADTHERMNGILFRQVEFALPTELTQDQQIELAQEFCQKVAGFRLPYTMAVHRGKGHNPHCHLLLSEKINDGHNRTAETWFKRAAPPAKAIESGGAKKADIGSKRKAWLSEIREAWATLANAALNKTGCSAHIDHRSLENQGLARIPSVHLGPNVVELEEKGISTDRGDRALQIAQANRQLKELTQIQNEIHNECTGPHRTSSQPTGNRRVAAATPTDKPTARPASPSGRSNWTSPKKTSSSAPSTENKVRQRLACPTPQIIQPQHREPNMLLAAEQQEFLRIRHLMTRGQEEEKRRRQRFQLSEKQKQRITQMIRLTEKAAGKRSEQLFMEDFFALDCMEELRQRRKTVEQVDWQEIEGKVIAGLLADGAIVADVAEVLYKEGVSSVAIGASPTGGHPEEERRALEYLKTLAASNPDLTDAITQAEKRQKNETLDMQLEQIQQVQQSAALRPM